jgi:uncharacterized membrane protein SirB2
MKTSNNNRIQILEFLPLILIVIYKMAIQTNSSINHQDKMIVMYVFIAISTVVFGYLLMRDKNTNTKSIVSIVILVSLIIISSFLFYYKK